MTSPDLPLPRRIVLTGTVGTAVALAGCDRIAGSADGDPTGRVATTRPAADADSALTDEVASYVAETLATVTAAASARGLRPMVTGFRRLHEAHGNLLGGLPEVASASPPRGGPQRIRAQVLAAEERLQRRLVAATMRAESGALAQTFAAMAAAVAQRRVAP